MNNTPLLLPTPRKLEIFSGEFQFSQNKLILLDGKYPQWLLFGALRIQNAIATYIDINYGLTTSSSLPRSSTGITLRIDPGMNIHPQGYVLKIIPNSISIAAQYGPGLFYGCCTLIQLIQFYLSSSDRQNPSNGSIPCLEIHDWPDFINRGVMLDISRNKVPTMETMFNLVDLLASWKINQLQLYTEHTFAYQNYPEVWADASPFTGDEILLLDAYCHDRFIELVPNQNSFGHLEHWLSRPEFIHLAEAPEGFDFPWGHHSGAFSLCPIDDKSLDFVVSLYDELLPHFSSRQVNVGCDETFDLGQGRSKEACAQFGTGRIYLEFLLKIYRAVTNRGFKMQFWGDMIISHPELISELPDDCIALEWGYEANHPFDKHAEKFAQAGLSFYVCPGTSSWNSIAGRTDNCIRNLANAAKNGLSNGAEGYLITDWGDNGHWQTLPVSYLGFATGAAYSWSLNANHGMDIQSILDIYAFQDTSHNLGRTAYDLGNIYHDLGIELDNRSPFFEIFQRPIHEWNNFLPAEKAIPALYHTLESIDRLTRDISNATSNRQDNLLLLREINLIAIMLRHACMRGLLGFGSHLFSRQELSKDLRNIIEEYQAIWLLRNRPGGLANSLSRFDTPLRDYE